MVEVDNEEPSHGAAAQDPDLREKGLAYAWHLLDDSCSLEGSPGINLRRLFKEFGKCTSLGISLAKQKTQNLCFQTELRESNLCCSI